MAEDEDVAIDDEESTLNKKAFAAEKDHELTGKAQKYAEQHTEDEDEEEETVEVEGAEDVNCGSKCMHRASDLAGEETQEVEETQEEDDEDEEGEEESAFTKKDFAALQNSDTASLGAKAQKYADEHADQLTDENENNGNNEVEDADADDFVAEDEDADVESEELSPKQKYAERQAEMAEMEEAKHAKYAEQQQAEADEEAEAEDEVDAPLDESQGVEPLSALPEEFTSLKSSGASLKWWAVLIIVVGSVLLVAALVMVIVFKCNAEYQMVRDKALSCCGFGHRYEPVKTAEEEERL